jgi:hypothetical protein
MPSKQNSSGEAVEVFRQFAWHLAGSLAANGGKAAAGGKPRPAKAGGKR